MKQSGDVRLILNLKLFNEHVQYEHFKMENLELALGLVEEGCFFVSIDLKRCILLCKC